MGEKKREKLREWREEGIGRRRDEKLKERGGKTRGKKWEMERE